MQAFLRQQTLMLVQGIRRYAALLRTPDAEPEHIHQYRVHIRRLRSALTTLRPLFGKNLIRSLRGELRNLVTPTSAERDDVVLVEQIMKLLNDPPVLAPGPFVLPEPGDPIMQAWTRQHEQLQRELREQIARTLRDTRSRRGLGTTLGAVLALNRLPRRSEPDPKAFGTQAVRNAARRIERRLGQRAKERDTAFWHRLRLEFKALRYAADFYGPVLGNQGGRIVRRARRLQNHLGDLHDYDEILKRLPQDPWLPARDRAAILRALEVKRGDLLERVQEETQSWLAWWRKRRQRGDAF